MAIDTISRALSGQASTAAKQAKETADSAMEQAISAVPGAVSDWLEDNVTPTTPVVDASLSIAGAAADAKATGDGIADLKSAFTIQLGKNLLDVSKNVSGYLNSNGTIHANPSGGDWVTTDYIDVSDTSVIVASADNGSGTRVALGCYFWLNYDEEQNIVGSQMSSNVTPYTIPSGVAYIRFSYHLSQTLPMVEQGSTRTEYEPYSFTRLVNDSPYIIGKNNGHGKNYLDISTNVSGYLNSDGTIHANPSGGDWTTTDYIDVSDAIIIVASADNGSGTRVALGCYFWLNYDEEQNIVGSQITNNPTPYSIPYNVKYIRFSYHLAQTYPMIEQGVERSAYESFENLLGYENSSYLDFRTGVPRSNLIVNHWQYLKWAVFGDSLTEKNFRATSSYYDYISAELGCKIVNYGASGTGYARTNSNFMTRMLNVDKNAFDVLTIFGSFNDAGAGLDIGDPTDTGTTTLCGCINTTIDNFYSVAPYKVIGLVTPCPWATIPPDNTWGQNYADAIIAIAKRRGIPCMDLFRESGIRPWAGSAYLEMYYKEGTEQDTGVHPNSLGHKIFLYPHFREFLKTIC